MVQKAEKETMQILKHGNRNQGYSIIESTIAILIASILLIVVLEVTSTFTKSTTRLCNYVNTYIEQQNSTTNETAKK